MLFDFPELFAYFEAQVRGVGLAENYRKHAKSPLGTIFERINAAVVRTTPPERGERCN